MEKTRQWEPVKELFDAAVKEVARILRCQGVFDSMHAAYFEIRQCRTFMQSTGPWR